VAAVIGSYGAGDRNRWDEGAILPSREKNRHNARRDNQETIHDAGTHINRPRAVAFRDAPKMTFSRLHIMTFLGIAIVIWTLINIFQGTLVIFEHFPLAPLPD